jgi:hypothetical protein
MSGRSSVRELVAIGLVLAGCKAGKPDADPVAAAALAAKLISNVPNAGGVRVCTPEDYAPGGFTITHLSALRLAKQPISDTPEHKDWINPPELDAPAVRTLLDPAADPDAQRAAAGEMLAAPYLLVYRVENVNAPMALELKEPKRSTIGTRLIRYEQTGKPTCVQVFLFQSTKKVSDWAIDKSDMTLIDPKVSKVLRDDLNAVYIAKAPRPAPAPQ